MVKLVIESAAGREERPFSGLGGAMNFALDLFAQRKLDHSRIEIFNDTGRRLFTHADICSACQQVRV